MSIDINSLNSGGLYKLNGYEIVNTITGGVHVFPYGTTVGDVHEWLSERSREYGGSAVSIQGSRYSVRWVEYNEDQTWVYPGLNE